MINSLGYINYICIIAEDHVSDYCGPVGEYQDVHHPNYHLTIPVGGRGVKNYCGGKAVIMRSQ